VFRTMTYVKLVVLMSLLAALSLMLGTEPWGPY